MRSGGTARKRAAAAGSTAIVTGVAAAAVGLFATPALAAAQSYDCVATTSAGTVNFALAVTVDGGVTNPPTVSDAVTLDNFQVHGTSTDPTLEGLLTTNKVDTVTGSIDDFPVSATAPDGTDEGSANPGTDGVLSVNATVGTDGSLSFDSPASAISLTGFTANLPGAMTFTAGTFTATLDLSGQPTDPNDPTTGFKDTASVTCTGTDQFATVTVADKAPPPPPPGTGNAGNGGTGNGDNGGNNGTGNGGASTGNNNGSQTHTTTPVQHATNTTSARPTLASTGAPYTIPMTATGAALLLLGGGMLVIGRRRRDLAIEGVADDGTTDGEPDAQD